MAWGNMDVTMDVYVMGLREVDVILGVAWLETLGKILVDWKEISMTFYNGEQLIELQGGARTAQLIQKTENCSNETSAFHSTLGNLTRKIGSLLWPAEEQKNNLNATQRKELA
ncbi:Aspartic peptidase domain superfamily [Sesbania bispinosa]|nr:Aspartic peptidase domain superfamily [Sesbania bispinosa]